MFVTNIINALGELYSSYKPILVKNLLLFTLNFNENQLIIKRCDIYCCKKTIFDLIRQKMRTEIVCNVGIYFEFISRSKIKPPDSTVFKKMFIQFVSNFLSTEKHIKSPDRVLVFKWEN